MTHDPRPILDRASLTQDAAARLLGVDARTMRRWCADPGLKTHRAIPEPAWRLLTLVADMPGVVRWLERFG